jgi:urease accessory protein
MERDASRMREGGPTIFAEVKNGKGVEHIVGLILSAWKASGAYEVSLERWRREGREGGAGSGDI